MANRFFTFLANLVAYQRAKAGDVAANFALTETAMSLVAAELDRALRAQASDPVIAPLPLKDVRKNRALTFDADGNPVATTTATTAEMAAAIVAAQEAAQSAVDAANYAASLYGILPAVAGQAGKVLRTDGAVWAAGDWWGTPQTLTVANNGLALTVRRTYHIDSSGGAFSLSMPVMATGDWIKLVDVAGQLSTNNVTITRNAANGNLAGYAEDRILDMDWDSVEMVKTASHGVIEQ